MLVGLTRNYRIRAGWFVALIYLFCVLAPAISYALPGEYAVPCLSDENLTPELVHVHGKASSLSVLQDGHAHRHSEGLMATNIQSDHNLVSTTVDEKSTNQNTPHSSDARCCGLMCVSAVPANLVDIVVPSAPKTIGDVGGYLKATDNAPATLYRPPIS